MLAQKINQDEILSRAVRVLSPVARGVPICLAVYLDTWLRGVCRLLHQLECGMDPQYAGYKPELFGDPNKALLQLRSYLTAWASVLYDRLAYSDREGRSSRALGVLPYRDWFMDEVKHRLHKLSRVVAPPHLVTHLKLGAKLTEVQQADQIIDLLCVFLDAQLLCRSLN